MALHSRISLTPTQRCELQAHLRRRNLPAGVAMRMKIVMMLDEGASYNDIKEKLDTPAQNRNASASVPQWRGSPGAD